MPTFSAAGDASAVDRESRSVGPVRLPRVAGLDGLRALLAWWVVVYHARGSLFSAAFEVPLGPLAVLSQGTLAVDAFMILSGFVIFYLLDREHEPYRVFALRRLLRLYPVYAVCFGATLLLHGAYVGNLHANAPHLAPELLDRVLHDAEQPVRDLGAQLAVHALMLHGAVPEAWLHNAAGAFLMPAWSISLEWQFYLVAPLIFWGVRRGGAGAAAWAAVAIVAFATRERWPEFRFDAFLPQQLHWFAIGIASYYAYKWVVTSPRPPALLRWAPHAVLLAVASYLAARSARFGLLRGTSPGDWLPLAIWAFTLAALLATAAGAGGRLAGTTRRALAWPPLERLGAVSYATYLVHWPLFTLCQAAFRSAAGEPSPPAMLALHVAISFPLIAAASFALHRWVEKPGIELGRRLAARLRAA